MQTKPEHCISCIFHRVIPDPDPNDSFNDDDMAIVCGKLENPNINTKSKWHSDHSPFRVIDCSLRPYQTGKVKTPDWCPLPE